MISLTCACIKSRKYKGIGILGMIKKKSGKWGLFCCGVSWSPSFYAVLWKQGDKGEGKIWETNKFYFTTQMVFYYVLLFLSKKSITLIVVISATTSLDWNFSNEHGTFLVWGMFFPSLSQPHLYCVIRVDVAELCKPQPSLFIIAFPVLNYVYASGDFFLERDIVFSFLLI